LGIDANLAFAVLEKVVVVAHKHDRRREAFGARLLDGREYIAQRDALVHTDLVGTLDGRAIGLRVRIRDADLYSNHIRIRLIRIQIMDHCSAPQ
jgi:hypothetical protein